MKNLDIKFVIPNFKNFWNPIGVAYIIAYLKKHSPVPVNIKVLYERFKDREYILEECADSSIVAFSCTTPTYQQSLRLIKDIKKLNPYVRTVVGGWHITTTRPTMPQNVEEYVDNVVIGEGEAAFLSIVDGNRSKIIYGRMMEFRELPWPDREAINDGLILDECYKMCGERIGSFSARRGCSHSCLMCGEKNMSNNNIRIRDNSNLLDEIVTVTDKYRLDKFKFTDPTFAYPKKATLDFCKQKISMGNTIPWECMGHAAYLDYDTLQLMKLANCSQVNIGVESGDQQILNDIKKGVTVEKIKKVFKWGHDLNLDMRAFFMIGFPRQDMASIDKTRGLIYEIQPKVVGFSLLTPFPGTDYYSDKFAGVDWSDADEYSNDFFSNEYFSNTELKEIQQKLVEEFEDIICWHNKENINGKTSCNNKG